MTSTPSDPAAPAPHPTGDLSDDDLFRELEQLYGTRLDTLRHGSGAAVDNSSRRISELEAEYRTRYAQREVDGRRLRPEGDPAAG